MAFDDEEPDGRYLDRVPLSPVDFYDGIDSEELEFFDEDDSDGDGDDDDDFWGV